MTNLEIISFLLIIFSISINSYPDEKCVATISIDTISISNNDSVLMTSKYFPENCDKNDSPEILFSKSNGEIIKKIAFSVDKKWESYLKTKELSLFNNTNRFILAVAKQPGGSDNLYESTIIAVSKGKVKDLFAKHRRSLE